MSQGVRESSFEASPFKNGVLADSISKNSKKNDKPEKSENNEGENIRIKFFFFYFFMYFKFKGSKKEKEKSNKNDSGKKSVLLPQNLKQKV